MTGFGFRVEQVTAVPAADNRVPVVFLIIFVVIVVTVGAGGCGGESRGEGRVGVVLRSSEFEERVV